MSTSYKITRSNAKTLEEWVELYTRKTGDKVDVPKGFSVNFLEERGFALIKAVPKDKMVMIYHMCGDARFWRDMAELAAVQSGMRYLAAICTRNIEAYIKFWHWTIKEQQEIDGQKRFICIDTLGRYVVITRKGFNDKTGEPDYWVTQYLVKGEKPVFSHSDTESE